MIWLKHHFRLGHKLKSYTNVKIALIDYGAGNIHSVQKALEVAANACDLKIDISVGANPDIILSADRIILPGDGAFADCVGHLRSIDDLSDALFEAVHIKARPFLGICVGMQLLATKGLELGETAGLGWLKGTVERIQPHDPKLKVPHMGWNTLDTRQEHPLLNGIELGANGLHAYFLHAYHFIPENLNDVTATADYGQAITAIVTKDNIIGTQFHPEKSQKLGSKLLQNFLNWTP
jgi:imidazole glycerol-phosphate synthase subunit HisH